MLVSSADDSHMHAGCKAGISICNSYGEAVDRKAWPNPKIQTMPRCSSSDMQEAIKANLSVLGFYETRDTWLH